MQDNARSMQDNGVAMQDNAPAMQGNIMEMRKALATAIRCITGIESTLRGIATVHPYIQDTVRNCRKALLAAPRRNCDVGTVAEQGRRFFQHCASFYDCASCPVNTPQNTDVDCALAWAQLPYQEGGEV